MSKITINEATQKRILQLAGLSDFEGEVLAENKKASKAALKENSSIPAVKKKEEILDEADDLETPEEEEESAFPEESPEEVSDVDQSPVGNGPPTDLEAPHTEASEGSNFVDVDFDSFAADLASLLKKNFNGVNFTMQVNGQEVASEPELDENEFGDAPDLESEEGMSPGPEELEAPPVEEEPEPRLESKKKTSKTVQLVYEAIIKNLVEKSGVKVNKNKKAEVKFVPKTKPTSKKK